MTPVSRTRARVLRLEGMPPAQVSRPDPQQPELVQLCPPRVRLPRNRPRPRPPKLCARRRPSRMYGRVTDTRLAISCAPPPAPYPGGPTTTTTCARSRSRPRVAGYRSSRRRRRTIPQAPADRGEIDWCSHAIMMPASTASTRRRCACPSAQTRCCAPPLYDLAQSQPRLRARGRCSNTLLGRRPGRRDRKSWRLSRAPEADPAVRRALPAARSPTNRRLNRPCATRRPGCAPRRDGQPCSATTPGAEPVAAVSCRAPSTCAVMSIGGAACADQPSPCRGWSAYVADDVPSRLLRMRISSQLGRLLSGRILVRARITSPRRVRSLFACSLLPRACATASASSGSRRSAKGRRPAGRERSTALP